MATKKEIELFEQMVDLLSRIERQLRPVVPEAKTIELQLFRIKTNGQKEEMKDMKLQLNENCEIKVKAIKDAAGNPSSVEGDALTWAISGDQSLGTLTVSEDGKTCLFVRNGAVGVCKVQVSGDADLGPDVKTIVGEVELECLGGEAVVFELDAQAVPVVP